jgi:molecular chaperone DnaJ
MKDYYQILGVDRNASKDDIKKAFRKLAHEHHPDKKTGNEAKFKEANEAYSVLSDDVKRKQYDTYGSAGPGSQFTQGGSGNGFEFDLGDIFGDIFGGGGRSSRPQRGRDISVDIEISFSESIFGVEKRFHISKDSECDHCHGTGGEPHTEMKTCSTCGGKGKVETVKRSFLGNIASSKTCETCRGKGKIPKETCKTCHGKGTRHAQEEIVVQVPAGINPGEMIRFSGKGEAVAGGQAGDLFVRIHIKPHHSFTREGLNLRTQLKVKLTEALLGAEKPLQTLDGDITLTIPEGIVHGEILRVKGRGVPSGKNRRGDLLVQIFIDFPTRLSRSAKKTIEELKKEGL